MEKIVTKHLPDNYFVVDDKSGEACRRYIRMERGDHMLPNKERSVPRVRTTGARRTCGRTDAPGTNKFNEVR